MTRLIRDIRIIPVVVFAAASLLALKIIGIGFDGGYVLGSAEPAGGGQKVAAVQTTAATPSPPAKSWAQEMFGFQDITGSAASKPAEKPAEDKGEKADRSNAINPPKAPDGIPVPLDAPRQPSPGERAVLERLQDRRQELDARGREIEIRENLLKAMEKRLEARAAEIKEIEGRITAAEKRKEEGETAKLKNLVTMYENMKAKEAAKIFDRLDMKVLIEVASQIAARRMSDIMAQMTPEAAERLTIELANRANPDKFQPTTDLPKIEGKANGS